MYFPAQATAESYSRKGISTFYINFSPYSSTSLLGDLYNAIIIFTLASVSFIAVTSEIFYILFSVIHCKGLWYSMALEL
jgi:hypothetical protein